jgi:hypothetical protein
MGKIFTECGDDVRDLCTQVLAKYHGNIKELAPKIGLFFVELDSETLDRFEKKQEKARKKGIVLTPPAALKLHGLQCAATIKANSYSDRVQGKPDVTITIDGAMWKAFTDEQQLALLDHELEHLVPAVDKDGCQKTDDLGRPLFKIKPHDFELSGFASVAHRHGRSALEVKTVVNFITDSTGQMMMELGGIKMLPATA